MSSVSLGKLGENIALKHLKKKGYRFVDRNFRSKFGEIDLILRDKKTLVFVEVKTRRGLKYGPPLDSIQPYKIRHIIKTVQYFLLKNPRLNCSYRLDAVGILLDHNDNVLHIRHVNNLTID